MLPGVDKKLIASLITWIDSAAPTERQARVRQVRGLLFDGADEAEGTRLEALIEEAQADAKASPAAPASPVDSAPERKRDRPRFYSPTRPGYRRASVEEGTAPPSSPFDAWFDAPLVRRDEEARSASSDSANERLAKLLTRTKQ